ncbi:multiple PDZ domain protein [Strongylocentrotus purpuratus]|uniref:PDZ domain-containing protein n=1 Tax=Strongylocentrotus purpuratus TaxID=7668 RepID=A0A7M7LL00_STRPU|nr:multiple PDZ domain protein [Strongylocentrotus purpuratus]|eukprot:XP_001197734.1 PREDICTED: multiple PDZ domain protein [Strongylocentrotus purpuratus]
MSLEGDTNSHVSFELHDFTVVTPSSSGDSPPPPYATNSDTASLNVSSVGQGDMMEDSFSVITESSTASYNAGHSRGFYGVEDDYDYPEITPSEVRKVTLEKNFRGFGLTVAGGSDSPYGVLPVFVTTLDSRGPAAESGVVRIGDRIVSVNSLEMEGKTHAEVVHAIKQSGRKVILELTEGPENIMNYLEFD